MTKKISLLLAIIMAFCSCIALSSCGGDPASENGEGEQLYVFDYHISDDGSYYIVTGYGVTTNMVSTINRDKQPPLRCLARAMGTPPFLTQSQ